MTYRRKDAHYQRARAEGYRARSAYKLAELDRRFRLMAAGDHVVDLGAWPGGWLQVASERVGPRGRVVGVDVAAIAPLAAPNVSVVRGDIREPATVAAVRASLGHAADVVLSDVAPKLTGVRATDDARAAELLHAVLATLPTLLRPGGHFVTKLFMGEDYERLLADIRRRFSLLHTTRPEATRRGSAELYVVGLEHFGTPPHG
jgi:23S rRNA (uridine2552-2'-O)-methyltransferase